MQSCSHLLRGLSLLASSCWATRLTLVSADLESAALHRSDGDRACIRDISDSVCKLDRRSRALGGLGGRRLIPQLPKDVISSAGHGMIAILQSKQAPLLAPLLMQSDLDVCYAEWSPMTDMLQSLASSQMSCFDILIPTAPGHAISCMQRTRPWLHQSASVHLQGFKEPHPVPLAAWCPPEMSSGWQQGSPWCIRGWPSLLTRLVHSPVWR